MEPDASDDFLGVKKLNYDFLQKIRDKKYGQAYLIGQKILKQNPNNPSIGKFMQFIEQNARKLDEMVKEEKEYQEVHSDDESDAETESMKSSSSGSYESGEEEDDEATKAEQEKPEENGKKEESSSDEESDKDSKQQEQEEEQEQPPRPEKQLQPPTFKHVPRHVQLIMEARKQGKM